MWPIRLVSLLLFAATLAINYVIGMKTGEVSDKFHLYVTPPGYFFTIWAVIYTSLAVINIYNLIKNVWSVKVHIFFALSNILNLLWIVVFAVGTNSAIYACSFILIALVPSILFTWI
jgi:benzodiazapine receptor